MTGPSENSAFHHAQHTESEAYKVFFQAVSERSLIGIVQAAHRFFGMPVLVTDDHYRLLCMDPVQEIGESIYDTLFHSKILPDQIIQNYQQEYLSSEKQFYESFYSDSGLVGNCPRIFGEIHTPDRIYGHFAIMMFDQPLYPQDILCANIFKKALETLMAPANASDRMPLSNYLDDLLNPGSPAELKLFAKEILEKEIPGRYAVMVTQIGQNAAQQAFAAMKSSAVHFGAHRIITTLHQGRIAILCGEIRGEGYAEDERSRLSAIAESLRQAGPSGISSPFGSLLQLPSMFDEADIAGRCGPDILTYFAEAMPLPIYEQARQSVYDMTIFIHPALIRIRDHDRRNGTEYYRTLQEYTFTFHDRDRTARILSIHRNTLAYRLDRISTLFGIDLGDARTSICLMSSFLLSDGMPS